MQEAHLVTAPGDGVGPAVLLSLGGAGSAGAAAGGHGASPTQYLFNVPEGFARLALEHRLRPGAGLRAAFACDAASLGGFGGLVMRLRGEGHEQLHVVGPPGCEAAVCSLRHFIHWRHPAVVLEESSPWERQPTVYQDDKIAVAALWKPPLLAAMWPAPEWLLQAQPALAANGQARSTSGGSSSSEASGSSSEEGSSGSEAGTSESESESSDHASGGISADTSSNSDSDASRQPSQQVAAPAARVGSNAAATQGQVSGSGMFDALDLLFMGGGGGKQRALEHLKEAAAARAAVGSAAASGVPGSRTPAGTTSATAVAAAAAGGARPAGAGAAAAAAAAKAAAARAPPGRRRQPAAGVVDAGSADVAVIGGKRFKRLPGQDGINVWVCQKLATKAQPAAAAAGTAAQQPAAGLGGAGATRANLPHSVQQLQQGQHQQGQQQRQPAGEQRQVLGFLCHLKATDQLLLLTNLHSRAAASQLQQHPALALLMQQAGRVAAVLHMAAPGVAGSRPLRQLCKQLQPAAVAGGGRQLLMELPGAHGSTQVIGHLAAARTTAKLNLVSSCIFPLPAGVRPPALPAPTPPGSDGAAGLEGAMAAAAVAPAGTEPAAGEPAATDAGAGAAAEAATSLLEAPQVAEAAPGEAAAASNGSAGRGKQPAPAAAHNLQQQQEQQALEAGSPSTGAAAGAAMNGGSICNGGLVHVRHASVLRLSRRPQQQQLGGTAAGVKPAVEVGRPLDVAICQQQPPAHAEEAAAVAAAGGANGLPAAAAQQAQQAQQAQLVLEPVQGFAADGSGFDAGAVQQEVQQERPQFTAQLQRLREQQQEGAVPGEGLLAGTGGAGESWCRQNQVAPPPPPPTPPLAAAVGTADGTARAAVAAGGGAVHFQQALPHAAASWQQGPILQQQQQQQPAMMRPLYLHQNAPMQPAPGAPVQPYQWPLLPGMQPMAPHAVPLQLLPHSMALVQMAGCTAGMQQQLYAMPPPPPPGSPPVRQQAEQAAQQLAQPAGQPVELVPPAQAAEPAFASNKRAAEGLRARLQGSKRSRQQPEQQEEQPGAKSGGAVCPTPAELRPSQEEPAKEPANQQQKEQEQQEQQQQQQQQPPGPPQWLEGAPDCVRRLASRRSTPAAGIGSSSGGSRAGGPEVLFLGTGSAEPSKYRAASAIQLRLSCGQSLLMDCGEGTLGALCRAHGTAGALRQVASLGCVWVSHRHADHMSGVLALLAAYPPSLPPLLLVGPRSLRDWLAEAAPALRLAGRYRFVHCAELNRPEHWARQALCRHLGITHMHCVPVRHCSDAYGLVLRHEEGWSLVYSGDTQPCQQLVQAGMGCTLLIHEATFEPCLEQQARQKRHSTTAEALDVAQRMRAYRCILTHFSQRYPKWPEGLSQAGNDGGGGSEGSSSGTSSPACSGAAVAFDGMRVPLALLPALPTLMGAVRAALADQEDAAEEEEEEEGDEALEEPEEEALAGTVQAEMEPAR